MTLKLLGREGGESDEDFESGRGSEAVGPAMTGLAREARRFVL